MPIKSVISTEVEARVHGKANCWRRCWNKCDSYSCVKHCCPMTAVRYNVAVAGMPSKDIKQVIEFTFDVTMKHGTHWKDDPKLKSTQQLLAAVQRQIMMESRV